MTQPHFQPAKGDGTSILPSISVHNFTPLSFPERLFSGRRLEVKASNSLKDIYPFSILVLSPDSLDLSLDYDFLFQNVGIILWDPSPETDRATAPGTDSKIVRSRWVDIRLSRSPNEAEIRLACDHMERLLELKEQCLLLHNANAIAETRNRQLNQIGVALISERNLNVLLNLILDKAMELTGSDAGCLYLVERKADVEESEGNYWANKQVTFKLTRNASVAFNFTEMVVSASKSSIIGYTLLEGKPLNISDVYAIDSSAEFRHNAGFDKTSGYRTRSMLTLPLKDHVNHVVGAIQLINKCRHRIRPITSIEAADEQVVAFQQEDVNLCLSLASQASVALLNAQYERDIQALFEGFINASVSAIESRDPTTSGHSHRVATYCMQLATSIGKQQTGKYRDASLSQPQLRELRYAALLHDFGKIGVREQILVKAKKLFPEELDIIQHRADFIKRTIQWQTAQAKVDLLLKGQGGDRVSDLRRLEIAEQGSLAEIEAFIQAIGRANEPVRMNPETLEWIQKLGGQTYPNVDGTQSEFLKSEELSRLMIPSGTLSEEERTMINSHVSHTYKFLSKIPWTQDLKQVVNIAFSHHEKRDGSGYPRKLAGDAIPLPSQIMTICDIFDALAATDRPYKKAIPTEKALDIIAQDVKGGKIEPELFNIFVESRSYLIQP